MITLGLTVMCSAIALIFLLFAVAMLSNAVCDGSNLEDGLLAAIPLLTIMALAGAGLAIVGLIIQFFYHQP